MSYAEIAAATNYSFLRGASHPHEMVVQAGLLGIEAIGIADRNTLAGIVRALDAMDHQDMPAKKPKLMVGARLVFADGTPDIVVYPTDRAAYGNLCRLLTNGKMRAKKGECILYKNDLIEWQEGLLLTTLPPNTKNGAKVENNLSAKNELIQHLKEFRAVAPDRVWLGATMPRKGPDKRRLKALARIAALGARSADRNERCALSCPAAPRIAGCRHLHPRACDARRSGQASRIQCRAASEAAAGNDAAVPRFCPMRSPRPSRFAARIALLARRSQISIIRDEPVPPGKTAQ